MNIANVITIANAIAALDAQREQLIAQLASEANGNAAPIASSPVATQPAQSVAKRAARGSVRDAVHSALKAQPSGLNFEALCRATGCESTSVRAAINRLRKSGVVEIVSPGVWAITGEGERA